MMIDFEFTRSEAELVAEVLPLELACKVNIPNGDWTAVTSLSLDDSDALWDAVAREGQNQGAWGTFDAVDDAYGRANLIDLDGAGEDWQDTGCVGCGVIVAPYEDYCARCTAEDAYAYGEAESWLV